MSKYGVFSGPYLTVFGLDTELNSVNRRIQSKYRKKGTRKNSVFGHFSRSDIKFNQLLYVVLRRYGSQIYANCRQTLFSSEHGTGGSVLQVTFLAELKRESTPRRSIIFETEVAFLC